MAEYENNKPGLDAINDMQFNASMDAFLESETFDGSGVSDSFNPSANHQANISVGSAAEGPRQGLLTTSSTHGRNADGLVYSLPQVPYAVAANNAAPLPSAMQGFLGVSYPVTVAERPTYSLSQEPCPIMPAPTGSSSLDKTTAKLPPKTKRSTPRRSSSSTSSKRSRDASAVSEDEEERQRRRQDRNAREQQRSHRITEQIDHLKEVLGAANVPFKPDKFSTLVTVSDYIKQLQAKSAMLDAEHKKLLDTISRTNEIVNDQNAAPPAGPSGVGHSISSDQAQNTRDIGNPFGPNLDYRSVFARCGVPLAVLSIDGRFLDCNQEFERLTGHTRDELLPLESLGKISPDTSSSGVPTHTHTDQNQGRNLSLFNLLGREYMEGAFTAMSEMLKHPADNQPPSVESKDYWTGVVGLSRHGDKKMQMNISLVRSPEGRARFFDCALTPLAGPFD